MTETKEKPKIIDGYDFVDATKDCVFKTIFTDPNLKEYLADIISEVTKMDKDYLLNNMEVVNGELGKNHKDEKFSTADLLVKVENNRINIEANYRDSKELRAKNNIYAHKIRGAMIKKGRKYVKGGDFIQINFDNYQRFQGDDRPVTESALVNLKTLEPEDVGYRIYHINLLKTFKMWYTEGNKSKFIRELALLKARTEEEVKKIVGDDKIMEMVTRKIRTLSGDEDFVVLYNAKELEDNIHREELDDAMEEGINKGLTKGIKQGVEQTKIETAKKMLEKGSSQEFIVEVTGLSKEELKKLIK